MAKVRKILATSVAVMIFFTLSLGLAGCREDNRAHIEWIVYAGVKEDMDFYLNWEIKQLEEKGDIIELCRLNEENKEVKKTIERGQEVYSYLHIRYIKLNYPSNRVYFRNAKIRFQHSCMLAETGELEGIHSETMNIQASGVYNTFFECYKGNEEHYTEDYPVPYSANFYLTVV